MAEADDPDWLGRAAPLHLRAVRAVAGELGAVRRALREWARIGVGLAAEQVDDIDLAVYEAMANVVEHAYPGSPGRFDIDAEHDDAVITVTVTDQGRWQQSSSGGSQWRGRGLLLIEQLAAEVEVLPQAQGTLVRMRWSYPAAPESHH